MIHLADRSYVRNVQVPPNKSNQSLVTHPEIPVFYSYITQIKMPNYLCRPDNNGKCIFAKLIKNFI